MLEIYEDKRRRFIWFVRTSLALGLTTFALSLTFAIISIWPQHLPHFLIAAGPVTLTGSLGLLLSLVIVFRSVFAKRQFNRKNSVVQSGLVLAGFLCILVSLLLWVTAPEPSGHTLPDGAVSTTIEMEGSPPVTIYKNAGDPHDLARYRQTMFVWMGLGLMILANMAGIRFVRREDAGGKIVPATV